MASSRPEQWAGGLGGEVISRIICGHVNFGHVRYSSKIKTSNDVVTF